MKFLFMLLWTLSLVISDMEDWDMSTSIPSRKWLIWISFLNLLLTLLLDMKSVFRVRIPENHFLLSQGHLNSLNLFKWCDSNRVLTRGSRRYFVTFIDYYLKFCCTYLLNSRMKSSINLRCIKPKLKTNLKHRSKS